MAHHHGAVGVAKDNLCTHVDELVDEEQAALKHLLVDEHAALGLSGNHEQHRDEVGGETGPGGIGDGHDGTVDEGVYFITVVAGDEDVVALRLYGNTQATEDVGDDAEVGHRHVLDGDAVAHHGSHADKRPHFYHVGKDGVGGTVKSLHTLDGEEVGGDAADAGTHVVEQVAQLLDVGLAGSIVDGGGALGKHRCHDDVGSAGDGGFVKKHVATFQVVGFQLKHVAAGNALETGSQPAETKEMGVEPPAANLVAARLGHHRTMVT